MVFVLFKRRRLSRRIGFELNEDDFLWTKQGQLNHFESIDGWSRNNENLFKLKLDAFSYFCVRKCLFESKSESDVFWTRHSDQLHCNHHLHPTTLIKSNDNFHRNKKMTQYFGDLSSRQQRHQDYNSSS